MSDLEKMREALHLLASTLFGPIKEDQTHYLRRLAFLGGDDLKVYAVKPTNDGGILTVKDARKIWEALQIEAARPEAPLKRKEPFDDDAYDKANWPSKEVLDAIVQGRETGYALGLRDATTSRAITEEMIDRALEAAKGAMVDTRRYWTDGDRAAVRAMLEAVFVPSPLAEKP